MIWPLGLPAWISGIFGKRIKKDSIGEIIRTDWPNIIHVELNKNVLWQKNKPKLFQDADGNQCLTIPIYQQYQGEKVIGTGIFVNSPVEHIPNYESGQIYNFPKEFEFTEAKINEVLGGNKDSNLIGFVTNDSDISEIKFELMVTEICQEGMLVWCPLGDEKVYYQLLNGNTKEEAFQSNRYGYQIGIARQLGKLKDSGFQKHSWLPNINTPVFSEGNKFGEDISLINSEKDFVYGKIPHTKLDVGGNFVENLEYHTAILGVTGSGKTELALDLIRYTARQGIKVVCIDLTMKYDGALEEMEPINLTLSETDTLQLNELLFSLDIGEYSKSKERAALRSFLAEKRKAIEEGFVSFLEGRDTNIAIISLKELSNTQATLYITEMYLTGLLNYAKSHPEMSKVLVVVEEAHTVMPEPSTMGLGDFDSKGLVGKIAQLSLQGRKFGIGLLVIAQRTATVSKSILTQCNTVISFSCFDDTSLNFLQNIFGSTYTHVIPNLPHLHTVVYGKALNSSRPLIVEIPFDENKINNNN